MTRRITRFVAALLVLAMLLTCVGAIAEASKSIYRYPEVPYEGVPVYGGVLRVGNRFSGVSNIGYPFTFATNSSWEYINACPALESMMRLDAEGNKLPWLASSWEIDAENLIFTIHLQPNVKFHDGTDFNAEAVVWNYEQYVAAGHTQFNSVDHFEAVDDLTVVAYLKNWDTTIEDSLLLTCGWMISPTAVQANGAEWATAHPVGTGPFVFDEWIRDVGVYYNKNENYWREGEPYLDRVEMCIYSDVTALSAALTTGMVDAVIPADVTVAKAWSEIGGINESGASSTTTAHCVMLPSNNAELPFHDVRVRQAIAYAIDAQAIAELMSEQGGNYVYATQIAVPGSISWNDDYEGYPYDPDMARKLLAEAGYPDGFTCPGYVIASNNLLRQCADIIAAYLSDVGINVENQNNDMALIAEMTAGTGKSLDGIVWFCTTCFANIATTYEPIFTENGTTYACVTEKPAELTEALRNAKVATTPEELAKYCKEMTRIVADQCLIVPIASQYDGQSIGAYVHNMAFAVGSNFDWAPNSVWMSEH